MMTSNHSNPLLIGEMVTISYLTDPSLGYGQFRLENPTAKVLNARVEDAWLEIGDRRQSLENVSIFDRVGNQPVDPKSFNVAAGAELSFLLNFLPVACNPRFGETYTVGLRIKANGAEVEALSSIQLVRRMPRER
jgi:hypothetical protein